MKNKTGLLAGFALGAAGFLLMFKWLVLPKISPSDELAPGIVVLISIFSGVFFAFIGSFVQNYLAGKNGYK